MPSSYTDEIDNLRAFVAKSVKTRFGKNRMFSPCLRASFARAFEFVELASNLPNEDHAFFIAPSLRGITEDVIFLRSLSKLTHQERETVVTGLMRLEVEGKLEKQSRFFEIARPFQPVLHPSDRSSKVLEDEIRDVWRANGWPKLNSIVPPTRELAIKSDPGMLEIVYDFVYRLTSGFVHFNPQVLYRSGWGSKSETSFSTKNMSLYYLACAQVYGGYLFCLYFEFFRRYLRPSEEELEAVRSIREKLIMESRWPEMVTFEEMNVDVPKTGVVPHGMIKVIHAIQFREGFIRNEKGAIAYGKLQSK